MTTNTVVKNCRDVFNEESMMQKEFNDTGLCIPGRHYMVDTSKKIERILHLIDKGRYFTINRPRQFGKTTTLSLLARKLNQKQDYLAVNYERALFP
jgi:hypothetical protein